MSYLHIVCIGLFLSSSEVCRGEGPPTHSHGSSQSGQLALNGGKKWGTDESLRHGMVQIRELLQSKLLLIHENRLSEGQYGELAKAITTEIQLIFKNCKLTAKADAMLHLVLVQVMDGVHAMGAGSQVSDRRAGALQVMNALGQYSEFFDHPGWQPLKD